MYDVTELAPDGLDYGMSPWNPNRSSAERQGRRRAERSAAARMLAGSTPTLYAIRCADGTIKIGWTGNLEQRLAAFRDGTVLAFVPGTRDDEMAVHSAFSDEHRHHGREWYKPTPNVLALVNLWRERFALEPVI